MNELRLNELMNGSTYDWISESMNNWMNEWINE